MKMFTKRQIDCALKEVVFGPSHDDAGAGRINMTIKLVLLLLGVFTDSWTNVVVNDRDIKEEADFGVGGLGFFSHALEFRENLRVEGTPPAGSVLLF